MEINSNYRNFIVAKDNKLIQSRYDLSMLEQKVILIMASKIQPQDREINTVLFKARELADILEVSEKNLYRDLPKMTKSLISKVIEIEEVNTNRLIQTHFVSTAIYNRGQGTVELKFSDEIKPYLLQLKTLFTSYKLGNILNLNSKYSIRLYEFLKSEAFKKTTIITIDDIRAMLNLTQKSYDLFGSLNKKVIEPAIDEINNNTDIEASCEKILDGRKVVALEFKIREKKINVDSNGNLPLENQIDVEEFISENKVEDSTILKVQEQMKELKIRELKHKTLEGLVKTYGEDHFKRASNIMLNKAREGERIKAPLPYLTGVLENLLKNASSEVAVTKQDKSLKFANFTQRDYDYDELEKGLLGWSKD